MPASAQLNTWIAESGSWQSFIDFKLSEDERARYSFLSGYDDFFISLMSRAIELVKEGDFDSKSEALLSVAKGLEIFSLREKRDYFRGVNQSNNILYAASLYYLSNYSASAWILSKIIPKREYQSEVDEFISNFLRRELSTTNRLSRTLSRYFRTGNQLILNLLYQSISLRKERAFNEDLEQYFSYLLAEAILKKFRSDNIWFDILQVGGERQSWIQYVNYNFAKRVPIWSFFPSQRLAIQNGILNGGTSSLQMPTSSGKTSITELIIFDEYKKNNDCRILYLAPYRALASELKQTLAVNLGRLGVSSKTIYGGNLPTLEEKNSIQDVNVLIATPEKFMAVEDIFPGISEKFTTIICDEGHLLDDESRGLNYELLLTRFKENSQNKKRFIFISAIIPNISVVNTWLGGSDTSLISSNYRPTELEYAFLKKMERTIGYYLDINPHKRRPYNYQLYKFLYTNELDIPNGKGGIRKLTSKKGLSVAVALKATNAGTVALFAPHKRGNTGVEGLASEAIEQVTDRTDFSLVSYSPESHLVNLVEYFSVVFGSNYLLTRSSGLGILFHHGDFPQSIREIIEGSLRESKIRLVICTNTLSEGVNLPIKTIVLHSTKRYNPFAIGNYSPIKIRDLKNLVGRAGRAGRETKGMVIIPHSEDFQRVNELIEERNIEPVKGELYNIINLITTYIERRHLQITKDTLDSLSENLQELLDSIDVSIIDLLAEEVEVDKLNEIVSDLIKQTLSFYQANGNEKRTLTTLFELRTEKLKPIVNKGEFKILKNSGINIRLYDEIYNSFNFDNDLWNHETNPLNDAWLDYIIVKGVFVLPRFKVNLDEFNKINKCQLKNEDVLEAIKLWMGGTWYEEIRLALDLETYQVLRLINSFISFNIQTVISGIVRLKELRTPEYVMPISIVNWSSCLQHGVDSQLKLDLIEMGLTDRVAVIQLSEYLLNRNFTYSEYKDLRNYLLVERTNIIENIEQNLPVIAFLKLRQFLDRLSILSLN
jgi:superfamily II DNA/RNA helicase